MKLYRIGSMGGTIGYRADLSVAIEEARTASINDECDNCETAVTEIEYRDDLSTIKLVEALLNHDEIVYHNRLANPTVIVCFRNGQEVACEDY